MTFDYVLRDNRVSALKPDGTIITSTYDELSRLTALNGGTLARAYTYDPQIDLDTHIKPSSPTFYAVQHQVTDSIK